MVRKMFCLLLALALLATSGVALAARVQDRTGEPAKNRQQLVDQRRQVLDRVGQIKANTLQIQQLKLEFGKRLRAARQDILKLIESKSELTAEQLARLREMNRLIRHGRLQLGSTVGQVREQSLLVRIGRLKNEQEEVLNGLERVLEIQAQRIAGLESLLRELETLEAFIASLLNQGN